MQLYERRFFLFDVYEDHSTPEKGLKNPKKKKKKKPKHTQFFSIESGVWNEYAQSDDIFWHFWLDVCVRTKALCKSEGLKKSSKSVMGKRGIT